MFAECTDDELRRIAEVSRIVETPAEAVLTKIGTPGDSFFFLIDGRVSVQTAVGGVVVERSHFWRLLNETPDLVRRILVTLSRRVRRLEQAANAMLQRINQT